MNAKQARLQHANDLIRVIASHGRRFFWHAGVNVLDPATKAVTWVPAERYASLELRSGRVYFIDDYTQKSIYTHKTSIPSRWRGFSHGGTLRALVEVMRDYIIHGITLHPEYIAPERINPGSNIWGYSQEEAISVREAAFKLPIIKQGGAA